MMLTRIQSLWTRVSRKGVAPDMDRSTAKRIVLANQFALSLSFLAFLFMPLHLLQGSPEPALAGALVAFAYLLVPWMHRPSWPSFSRMIIVTAGNLGILLFALHMGAQSDMHIYFCTGTWMGLVLFAPHERKSLAFSVLLPTCMLAGFLLFDRAMGGWNPQPPDKIRNLWFYNLVSFQLVQVAAVLYFYISNHRSESALAKAGELAQSADRAKSRFLANISHEVRTPLNGILGLSGLLLGESLTRKQRETLLGVHASALDLLGLVNDLLDISRIEAGMMRLDPAPFRLRALCDSLLAPFRFEAERKRLDLHLEIAADVPDSLLGDSGRLKQVLNNLLGNAFKFTDQGGVRLRVVRDQDAAGIPHPSAQAPDIPFAPGWDAEAMVRPAHAPAPAAPGVTRLRFEVEDTGIGIPDASRSSVFRPFTQVDQSASRRHEGAGLGLFISRQLVERMGGFIGYRSAPGQGSVFHFTVDLPPAEAPAEPSREPAFGDAPHALKDLPALIVEDHALNRKVISGMLAARGLSADEAPGGREALEAMSRRGYRLVFTDLHMPGMDGFEFTRQVRAGAGPQPLVVGVTADAMAETRSRCLQSGMDDVLTKPILARDLEALLTRLASHPGAARAAGSAASAPQPAAAPAPAPPAAPLAPLPEPARRAGGEPWLDLDHVLELDEWVRVHDAGFWDRAVVQFRSDVDRLAKGVREAMAGDRVVDASEAAHALKGVALMLGFSRLGGLANELDERIREAGGPGWQKALAALEAGVEPSAAELRHRLPARAASAEPVRPGKVAEA